MTYSNCRSGISFLNWVNSGKWCKALIRFCYLYSNFQCICNCLNGKCISPCTLNRHIIQISQPWIFGIARNKSLWVVSHKLNPSSTYTHMVAIAIQIFRDNHLHHQHLTDCKPSSPTLDCIKFSEEIGEVNCIVELWFCIKAGYNYYFMMISVVLSRSWILLNILT